MEILIKRIGQLESQIEGYKKNAEGTSTIIGRLDERINELEEEVREYKCKELGETYVKKNTSCRDIVDRALNGTLTVEDHKNISKKLGLPEMDFNLLLPELNAFLKAGIILDNNTQNKNKNN